MAIRDTYITWMKDAYAMEMDITKFLEGQIDDAQEYPELQAKIEEHLDLTRKQAERVKECLERNGEEVSEVKSWFSQLMGITKGVGAEMMKDKIVKGGIIDHGTEHTEMAAYQALMVAAEMAGDEESKEVFKQIKDEEEEMANWLEDNLDKVTREYLEKV
jgi:ferritin-like metal-binding protein YciE